MKSGLNKTSLSWKALHAWFFGFAMAETISAVTVKSMNKPPNIASGILKTGSPWRTWFVGSASA